MNKSIGILDSGVGGLTVWREIIRQLPHESTVYIADSANIPYGSRAPNEIYRLAKRLIAFLLAKDVKLIVVACNTITVTCLEQLRRDFPQIPLIGTVPVVKTAATRTRNKTIGILSTTRTSESQYQHELIQQFAANCTVVNLGTDDLVPLIEQGELSGEKTRQVLAEVLGEFQTQHIDTLALGCTHYPFLTTEMQAILGSDVTILDSGAAIARHVRRVLEKNEQLSREGKPAYQFFTTGDMKMMHVLLDKLGHATPHINSANLSLYEK